MTDPGLSARARAKLEKADIRLVRDDFFFGSLAAQLPWVESADEETCSVDGINRYYSPKFIDELTLDQTIAVSKHEILHVAQGHCFRRGGREADLWNVACDHEINQFIPNLPKGALLDPTFKGMAAEDIFALKRKAKSNKDAQQQDQKSGQGQGSPQQGQGQPSQQPGQGQGASGQGQPGTQPAQSGGGSCPWGKVKDAPVKSVGEKAALEQQWQQRVLQAAMAAKAQAGKEGDLPGWISDLVKDIRAPKVDWREVLRRFCQQVLVTDYTWSRPNKRFRHLGLYLPSPVKEGLQEIVVVVDTSGSIDLEMLAQFAGELTAVVEDVRPEKVHVVYCDTRIAHTDEFGPNDEIKLEAKGRGGTDFRPPFEWVEEQGIDPACLVYLTDMECTKFPDEPNYPVLWASYGRARWNDRAPFGEVVIVKQMYD